jgi:hypothetical protein
MRSAAILLLALVSARCAPKPPEPAALAVAQCEEGADRGFANRPASQLIEPNQYIVACMAARGFKRDPSSTGCQQSRDPYSDAACYRPSH